MKQILAIRSTSITELKRPNADLCAAIQEGMDSGPAIAAENVFAELPARYAEPGGKRLP